MKYIFLIALMFLASCSSKEKAVNSNASLPLLPMVGAGQLQDAQDSIGRAPTSAIEGTLFLQNDLPTPLSNVQVALFKKTNNRWVEISKLSTDGAGSFRFTQKLSAGAYDVRVVDSRFKGSLPLTLEDSPARGLILYATKSK